MKPAVNTETSKMFKKVAQQQALNLRQKIALQNAKKLHALRKQAAVEGSLDQQGTEIRHQPEADGRHHHDHVNVQQLLIRRNAIFF